MATTEERLEALEQKMQMLTTPPDDYYMSRWTGEEIDAAVATAVNAISKIVKYYPGTEDPDIDTILDSSFVIPASASKNCPVAGLYIIIYQFFYAPSGTVSAASPRTQIALSYSAGEQGKGMALRTFSRESVWSGWEKIYTDQQPPTAAEVGAAPSGFGLGETTPGDIPLGAGGNRDLNLAVKAGWYYITSNATYDNSPIGKTGFPLGGYHVMRVEGFYFITQTIYLGYQTFTGCVIQRHTLIANNYDAWSEWEWINPPMQLGVEYRTTERYNGKPVYKKVVNFGNLPNNSNASVAHNIENILYVLSGDLINQEGTLLNGYLSISQFVISRENIVITTTTDMSSSTGTVRMKYTKSTD